MRSFLFIFMSFLTALTITACDKAPKTPEAVAETYWKAIQTGDYETAKSFAPTLDIAELEKQGKNTETFNMTFKTVETAPDATEVKVPTTFYPPEGKENERPLTFNTVLNHTESGWKVNYDDTNNEMFMAAFSVMGDMLKDAMKNSGKALEKGVEAFSKALKEDLPDVSVPMAR